MENPGHWTNTSTILRPKKILWYFTFISAAIYPYLLNLFSYSMEQASAITSMPMTIIFAALAFFAIALGIVTSYLAILLAAQDNDELGNNRTAKRTLLIVLAATPPLYIVTLQLFGAFNIASQHKLTWVVAILITGLLMSFSFGKASKREKSIVPFKLVRKIHRISAVLLIFGFVLIHIANHIFALHSYELHETVRTTINLWYQSDIVEPVLFLLLAIMMLTGVPMVTRYLGTRLTLQRSTQLGSGIFLVFFFIAHVNAVLSARERNVETDWIFATGEQGLLASSGILIPYYILSVAMIFMHIAGGLKSIHLRKNKDPQTSDLLFMRLMFISLIITILVSAAVLGIQF